MSKLLKTTPVIILSLGLAIFCWSALFVWQGLDFTDMGFSLTLYQQFYTAPEANSFALLNWLTAFIGHWLGESLGGSVVSYKLVASAVLATTGVLAYQALRAIFGHHGLIAFFVFIAFLFSTKAAGNWINYNNLTALFYTLGGILLFFGLIRERRILVSLAGGVLAASLFIRFPNLLGMGLVVTIFIYGWLQKWSLQWILAWSGYFLLGWIVGFLGLVLLIVAHDHQDHVLLSLSMLFEKATDNDSSHSGTGLITLFLRDHLMAFLSASVTLAIGSMVLKVAIARPKLIQWIIYISAGLLLMIALHFTWQWLIPGLLYLGLFWIVAQEWKHRDDLVLLAFIALAILICAPLGSGNGIRNAIYAQWLALPLVLAWLCRSPEYATPLPFVPETRVARLAGAILSVTLMVYSLSISWFYTYRDSKDRTALVYSLNHPLLVGTYTTKERADMVNDLLGVLPQYVRSGDAVLAYPSLPTLHYVTHTQPWLGNSWPVLYEKQKMETKLVEKMASDKFLPVVVRSLGDTRNRDWPINASRNRNHPGEESWQVLDEFVVNQGYRSVWHNDFFEVLVAR